MFCVWAGGELCAAGQVGRSQTDAGEAGHATACCEEHVQADGHSAQQDALLQCKIIYQKFILLCSVSRPWQDDICMSFYVLINQN